MKSNLLIIPGYRLYPLETGASLAQFAIIDYLRSTWNVTILIDSNNLDAQAADRLRAEWHNVEIIRWEDLKSSWEQFTATSIAYRLKRKFSSKQEKIELPKVPESLHSVWANVSILYYEHPEWEGAALNHYLKNRHFDIVQTDLPVHLHLAKYVPSPAKTVHICHELKSKRLESSARMLGLELDEAGSLINQVKSQEFHLIADYDLCICFSQEDQALISAGTDTKVAVSPFPLPDSTFSTCNIDEIKKLVFLGPEKHGPNKEGLEWFLQEIWPHVSTDLALHVVGHWEADTVRTLSSKRVIFEGFVEDLAPYLKQSIHVVPINSGAGIRTKIIQAMAKGVPVIGTSFAIQGLELEAGINVCLFENEKEFQESLEIMADSAKRKAIAQSGYSYVRANFNRDKLGAKRSNVLQNLLN